MRRVGDPVNRGSKPSASRLRAIKTGYPREVACRSPALAGEAVVTMEPETHSNWSQFDRDFRATCDPGHKFYHVNQHTVPVHGKVDCRSIVRDARRPLILAA